MRQKAFTLAEVLITLAIIGVVAAVTIPTLIAKYQEKAWKTSADVFDRKLTEALNLMNTNDELVGYKNTEEFVKAFSKYVKIAKVCNEDNLDSCWIKGESKDATTLVLSKNNGQKVQEIKLVKECTGLGLKESKDIIDKVYAGIPQTITCNDKAAKKQFIEDFGASGIAGPNDDLGELCKNGFCITSSSITADALINKLGGNKLQAIKFIRECSGLGLKEAKELVDSGTVYCNDSSKLANLGLVASNANVIIFADGNQVLLQYNPNCTKVDLGFNKCVGVVYDTTGAKKPNVIGKDRGVLIK